MYRVVRIPDEGSSDTRSFICEVEDTFDADRTDGGRSVRALVDMKRRMTTLPRGIKDFTPFSIWKPPIQPHAEREKFQSIAHGRMGFLIVFDVNSPESFSKATELYDLVKDFAEYRNSMISPVIFLVANKTDVDPQGDVPTRLLGRAELYAQQVFCRLWQVSAHTGKNIKKANCPAPLSETQKALIISRMFVDMIQLIYANGMLWELDYQEESASEESDEDRCTIM
ncbi:Ras family domain-containing protein [Cyclospora cayetanensis]|uniref:Ras family domain-containing protein n=1 Tax=Cyclospora cayetanensis TaxID=88456 RepID=A0A1D3D6R6_9EIME|nr:Ras family domain-containing protein [Cyclospora cayetanensis]